MEPFLTWLLRPKEHPLADLHVKTDTLPALPYQPINTLKPTVAALKTALNTHSATSYTASRMHTMSYNDLVYAARLHGLSVVGL